MRRISCSVALSLVVLSSARGHAKEWRLPFSPGASMNLTQDCNDSCCDDHVGAQKYAYDFANGSHFAVRAARDGTVVHLKQSSNTGGVGSSYAKYANYVVLDHGDGHLSLYWHLQHGSIDPAVRCGEFVRRGQILAKAGSTGFSTGTHLHFQVGELRPDMSGVCECGADGNGCAASAMTWNNFIATSAHPTVAISMDDWPDSAKCSNRAYEVDLESKNADAKEATYVVDDDDPRFAFVEGEGTLRKGGAYHENFHSAASAPAGAPTAVARYDFGGLVTETGVFEVLSFVPYNDHADTKKAKHIAVARGARVTGELGQNVIGGAFHRVPKLDKLKFSGRAGEAIVVQNDTGEAGKSVGFDAVLLHWVGPAGAKTAGELCEDATECDGALVCAGGACAVGCDDDPCPCGQACDDSALCVPDPAADCGLGASAGLPEPVAAAGPLPGLGDGGAGDSDPDDGGVECAARPAPRDGGVAWVGLVLVALAWIQRPRRGERPVSRV